MSKRAEEAALKAYPITGKWIGNQYGEWDPDINRTLRAAHQQGYEQAEKDLGWFSFKDRLPGTTDYVTCIKMNGIPQCVRFHYYKDGKWFEEFEEDTVGAEEYWMPIPKLPNEDE